MDNNETLRKINSLLDKLDQNIDYEMKMVWEKTTEKVGNKPAYTGTLVFRL